MKKILKGLAKYVAFTILLACFLPLSLQHVQAILSIIMCKHSSRVEEC